MAFLNNKISFTAEYFWKDNNDLLAPLLPLASSGQTIMTNGGICQSLILHLLKIKVLNLR